MCFLRREHAFLALFTFVKGEFILLHRACFKTEFVGVAYCKSKRQKIVNKSYILS